MCSMGAAPSTLMVVPVTRTMAGGPPAATIMDNKPFLNVPPFGCCMSPSNPSVAAVFPALPPCVPCLAAPWMPGAPTVLIGDMPALTSDSKLMCNWGGVIQVTLPGQFTVMTP